MGSVARKIQNRILDINLKSGLKGRGLYRRARALRQEEVRLRKVAGDPALTAAAATRAEAKADAAEQAWRKITGEKDTRPRNGRVLQSFTREQLLAEGGAK